MSAIVIVPYQSSWPSEFSALGSQLRAGLGGLALRIDHIGSTAIPGLAAKDVIDIQVTVVSFDPLIEHVLTRSGYRRLEHISRDHIPPGSSEIDEEWAKWFFKAATNQRPVNLHVRISGRANQRYPLLFRDYLRAHKPLAEAYAQVKTALARLRPEDLEAYYDVKDPVCDIIMTGAEAWAAQLVWTLHPSDC